MIRCLVSLNSDWLPHVCRQLDWEPSVDGNQRQLGLLVQVSPDAAPSPHGAVGLSDVLSEHRDDGDS